MTTNGSAPAVATMLDRVHVGRILALIRTADFQPAFASCSAGIARSRGSRPRNSDASRSLAVFTEEQIATGDAGIMNLWPLAEENSRPCLNHE
jgi:hypothetical protein